MNVYLDYLQNIISRNIEFQGYRSTQRSRSCGFVVQFLVVCNLYNTHKQYLALTEGFTCFVIVWRL